MHYFPATHMHTCVHTSAHTWPTAHTSNSFSWAPPFPGAWLAQPKPESGGLEGLWTWETPPPRGPTGSRRCPLLVSNQRTSPSVQPRRGELPSNRLCFPRRRFPTHSRTDAHREKWSRTPSTGKHPNFHRGVRDVGHPVLTEPHVASRHSTGGKARCWALQDHSPGERPAVRLVRPYAHTGERKGPDRSSETQRPTAHPGAPGEGALFFILLVRKTPLKQRKS